MAEKIAHLLRRYPVVAFVLVLALALLGAKVGHPHHHPTGLWDGPI